MLRLEEPFGVGLLLLGSAAGAPFLPKLAELSKGSLKRVVTLGAGRRNIAAAQVVASQSFDDPKVVVMVAVVAIVRLLVLMPLLRVLGERGIA